MPTLTKQIAKQYRTDPDKVSLNVYTAIDVEAAEVITRHKGHLYLTGLTSLSDGAAEALARHAGHVHLGDLKEISDTGLLSMAKRLRQIHWAAGLTKRLKQLMSASVSDGKASPPQEWSDGRVVLQPPGKDATWRTQSYLSKHKGIPTSLFKWFTSLLPEAHLREVDYGYYKVQEMTEAAAGLLVENRSFFEAIRSSGTRKERQRIAGQRDGDMQALEEVAAHSGYSAKEVVLKHQRLAELAAAGNLALVAEMLTSGDSSWVHDSLLVGAGISDEGRLVMGEPLRRLGSAYIKVRYRFVAGRELATLTRWFAEGIGVLALSQSSPVAAPGGGLRMERLKNVAVISDTFTMLVQHVFCRYPALCPWIVNDEETGSASATVAGFLSSLDALTEAEAETLARHRGKLDLRDLKTISSTGIKTLSRHQGDLDLSSLTEVTDEDATALAQHSGRIMLRGLKALSGGTGHVALATAQIRDSEAEGTLWLDGLETISVEVASVLSRFPGTLDLRGLTSLPEDCAVALGRHLGDLRIGGLASLSAVAAKAISRNRGELDFSMFQGFASGGSSLITLPDDVAEALSRHVGILRLDNVSRLSDKASAALAQHEGLVRLNGLVSLPPNAAKHLSRHRGGLSLYGLKDLSESAAECLAAYDGELRLSQKAEAAVTRARKKLSSTNE